MLACILSAVDKSPLIATAANNPDFICASQQFLFREISRNNIS